LTADDIEAYFRLVDPLDKAGAYGIQEHGDMIVAQVDGLLSNVIGLPVEELFSGTRASGMN
jgi:septum formation protein